jgi:histidinol-phosphate aminotransferase
MIPRAFGEPGDSSVIAVPTFFTFAESNHAFKVRNHLVRLREDDDFAYDEKFVERFIQTIKKCCAKTAWLSSPNNPLGNVITREAVIKILRSIPQDCVLIVDEVFYDFYDPANRQSALGLIEQHKNLLVLRSLSKPYGLAGIRCGYAAGHQSLIKTLDILRPYFNLSAFSLDLAKAVLVDHGYIKKVVRITRREREKMFKVISRLENYHLGGQSVSNIFILKHKKRDLWQSLVRKNILAADFRQSLGLEGKGYVRLTVQSPEKNQKLLQVLKELN